jgi:hypothetical protein
MVGVFAGQHPPNNDGATALRDWTADWRALLERRAGYTNAAVAGEARGQLVIPVIAGAPITNRMNEYALANAITVCQTTGLQAEVVVGKRTYPAKLGGI